MRFNTKSDLIHKYLRKNRRYLVKKAIFLSETHSVPMNNTISATYRNFNNSRFYAARSTS